MSIGWEDLAANALVAMTLGAIAWSVLRLARRPALAHLLFLLAMAKLVTPPLLPLPWVSWTTSRDAIAAPVVGTSRDLFSPAVAPAAAPPTVIPAAPTTAAELRRQRPEPEAADASAPRVLLLVWIAGSLLVTLVLWRRLRRFAAANGGLQPAPEPWSMAVQSLAARIGLTKAPLLRVVDAAVPPTVFWSRGHTHLWLPSRCLRRLPADAVRALLVHELAHLRRRDHWVRVFEAAMTVLWWWLPLLWWLRHGLRDAEERSCDAWVAAVLPDARQAYCRALLHVAASDPALPVPAFASATRRIRNWKSRLEDVMTRRIPHRTSALARTASLLLGALALPLALPARAQDKSEAADVASRLATVIEATFDSADLDQWTQWLTRVTGVPFTIEPSARQGDPDSTRLRSLQLPPMPARRVLNVIAAMTDLHWRISPSHVVIERPADVIHIDGGDPTPHCSVFGAASKRGTIPLEPGDTVFAVLARCGWSDDADLGRMVLIRPDRQQPRTFEIDLKKAVTTGQQGSDVTLQDNDILFVPWHREQAALPPERLEVGSRLEFVLYGDWKKLDCEQLGLLADAQRVGRDGTIFVPYVGHLMVLGRTQDELAAMVRAVLQPLFTFEIQLHARFLP